MDISEDKRKLIIKFASANKDKTALKFINEDPEGVVIRELSGGVVNYVYRVASSNNRHSVVLKHAEESLKVNDGDKVPVFRQITEYECLKLFNSVVPGCVPEPYCLDAEYNIIAMEDLSDMELLGDSLQTKGANPQLAAECGRVLAKLHQATMKGKVSQEYWQELCKLGIKESRNIIQHYNYERYYGETEKIAKLPQAALDNHQQFIREAIETGLLKKLLELFNDEQCLLQVDCHWNSIFVKDNCVAMFDFDLATLSHPATALGYIGASYFVCFLMRLNEGMYLDEKNTLNNRGKKQKQQFQEALQCLLVKYTEERALAGEALGRFISDTALSTGNAMFVLSSFENMATLDPHVTVQNQVDLLHTGIKLMKAHGDITTVAQLVMVAFDIDTFY